MKKSLVVVKRLKFGESCAEGLLLFVHAHCFCAEKFGKD
jgi:hypothetical protein